MTCTDITTWWIGYCHACRGHNIMIVFSSHMISFKHPDPQRKSSGKNFEIICRTRGDPYLRCKQIENPVSNTEKTGKKQRKRLQNPFSRREHIAKIIHCSSKIPQHHPEVSVSSKTHPTNLPETANCGGGGPCCAFRRRLEAIQALESPGGFRRR